MTTIDSLVHHAYIEALLNTGRMTSAAAVARQLSVEPHEVVASLRELARTHGLVLHPHVAEPWVIHPFSGSPTATWVECGDCGWWAPCIWCACGIAALAKADVAIHSRIGGQAEAVTIHVSNGQVAERELLVHFSSPPRDAWNNVHHFCATVLPFRSADQAHCWSRKHGLPLGAVIPLPQVMELARAWYGGHADRNWRKWSVRQANEIFASVGLTGPFWDIPDEEGWF